jgi:hypothetical protein
MTDDQLRALIRDAVARHLAGTSQPQPPPFAGRPFDPGTLPFVSPGPAPAQEFTPPAARHEPEGVSVATTALAPGAVTIASAPGGVAFAAAPGSVVHLHVSHATFALPAALDGSFDGPCRTEPHSACTNCGFCQSLGY